MKEALGTKRRERRFPEEWHRIARARAPLLRRQGALALPAGESGAGGMAVAQERDPPALHRHPYPRILESAVVGRSSMRGREET